MSEAKKSTEMIYGQDISAKIKNGAKADAEAIAKALTGEKEPKAEKCSDKNPGTSEVTISKAEKEHYIAAGEAFENSEVAKYVIQGFDNKTILREIARRFSGYEKFYADISSAVEKGVF